MSCKKCVVVITDLTEHITPSQEAHLPGPATIPQNPPSVAFLSHFTPRSYLLGVSDYPSSLQDYEHTFCLELFDIR